MNKVVEAAKALIEKLEVIHENAAYQSVWTFYTIHGMKYDGPTYEREFESLKTALSETKE